MRYHIAHRKLASSLFAVVIAFAATPCRAIDFATIESAWRDRERNTPSVVLRWNESRVHVAPRPAADGKMSKDPITQEVPNVVMYLRDGQARLEDSPNKSTAAEDVNPQIEAFDKNEARSLYSVKAQKYGVIRAEKRPAFSGQMNSWPPLLLYRGLDDSLISLTLAAFAPGKGELRENPNGTVTLRTSAPIPRVAAATWTLTLRPDLNYAPVQLTGLSGDTPFFDLKISYGQLVRGIPIPTAWSVSGLNSAGALIASVRATVTSTDLDTAPAAELFDLSFPDGTMVYDMRPKIGGGEMRTYLVTDRGERDVLDAELLRGATIDQLRATRSGEAGLPGSAWHGSWLFWANVVVVLVVAVALIARYLRRSYAV